MKLLADQPTVDVEEPPHRPVLAILGGVAVLVLMIGVGLTLLLSGGPVDEQPVMVADDSVGQSADMASWTASANAACYAAGDTPLVAREDGSLADTDRAVRNLVVNIREIPIPADRQARALILPIVLMGDDAETAWWGISGLDRDEISASELDDANALAQAFVNGLVDIGADCSALAE
ncbi:MAG TPA: hypothetical protein VFZ85_16480 [Jiangellaceae bacterium]